jgi:hypothetical protein
VMGPTHTTSMCLGRSRSGTRLKSDWVVQSGNLLQNKEVISFSSHEHTRSGKLDHVRNSDLRSIYIVSLVLRRYKRSFTSPR